ncbi:MAG: chorismate synthase [Myxococcota bacterium]
MGSTLGRNFRVTTWGESHGGAVGVVVDGCPARLPLALKDIQADLDRRRPGQSRITTQRKEEDAAQILSGVFEGKTLGTPISILVWNKDTKPEDYLDIKNAFRPSHADFTYQAKYGIRNWMGGGRASARETVGRVAAGAIARKLLKVRAKTEIVAYVKRVQAIEAPVNPSKVKRADVERNIVRCPDPATAEKMIRLIEKIRKQGDSAGGVVELVARNVPAGLGEPVFDKLEADLAKALMSLPASKAFEIGSGLAGTFMLGSEHNDPFVKRGGRVRTKSNRSGGVQGGISNGEDLVVRVAFKPTATIMKPQQTVDARGRKVMLAARGRHDPCVLPRAVPMVEAMVSLVLADHLLRQQTQKR